MKPETVGWIIIIATVLTIFFIPIIILFGPGR